MDRIYRIACIKKRQLSRNRSSHQQEATALLNANPSDQLTSRFGAHREMRLIWAAVGSGVPILARVREPAFVVDTKGNNCGWQILGGMNLVESRTI
jgi:hypothetical protein